MIYITNRHKYCKQSFVKKITKYIALTFIPFLNIKPSPKIPFHSEYIYIVKEYKVSQRNFLFLLFLNVLVHLFHEGTM